MGCVSSKLVAKEIDEEKVYESRDYAHHVVSLTSSTYGVLNLDKQREIKAEQKEEECCVVKVKRLACSPSREEAPEIINAWELMEGLEEEVCVVVQSKKSSPLKLLSPRKAKKGKENKGRVSCSNSPNITVLKECNNLKKPSPKLWASIKAASPKCESLRFDLSTRMRRRRSLGPLFDPDPDNNILESYKRKCPPGGEDAVVIYTTTLRGIRKTFEECNVARSIVESQGVQMFERDISMHSAFREELRVLMGSREVKVPVVFVRGWLIGGAEEMVKLDEEGKLGVLFSGIPKAEAGGCAGCGGVRFVMCTECSGSCKVLGEDGKKSEKCKRCNENGLIQCPMCCCLITI